MQIERLFQSVSGMPLVWCTLCFVQTALARSLYLSEERIEDLVTGQDWVWGHTEQEVL